MSVKLTKVMRAFKNHQERCRESKDDLDELNVEEQKILQAIIMSAKGDMMLRPMDGVSNAMKLEL